MLDGPLLLPPLVLAVLLAVSGVAKLLAPADTRSAFHQLRLPRWLADGPAPGLLPWGELVLAALLLVLPRPASFVVAGAALVLVVLYLVVILRALRFPYPVTCGCFGRLGLGEVTTRTAWRNLVLVVVAVLTVVSAGAERSVVVRLLDASAVTWAWLGLLLLGAGLVLLTFGAAATSPSSPAPQPAAPADAEDELLDYERRPIPFGLLEDAHGARLPLTTLAREQAHLLVFVSPGCGSCAAVMPQVREWDEALGPVVVRAVVAVPVADAVAVQPTLEGVTWHDPEAQVLMTFGAGTPSAVLLGTDGLLAGGPALGRDAIEELVRDVRDQLLEAGMLSDR